jgi:very-short-patch-repair endonuclease
LSNGEREAIADLLLEMAYSWVNVEREIEVNFPGLSEAIRAAFKIEARYQENWAGDPATVYFLSYDVRDPQARVMAKQVRDAQSTVIGVVSNHVRVWDQRSVLEVEIVTPGRASDGETCARLRPNATAFVSVEDVPTPEITSSVPLIERDGYQLTPIEVPFYDALRDTGLFFSVQPWIQGTDRKYRLDFLIFYDGGAVAVELDGHEYHKSKEHRRRDAARDRWFAGRGIKTLRWTGSEVHADAGKCVAELLDVLRGANARP